MAHKIEEAFHPHRHDADLPQRQLLERVRQQAVVDLSRFALSSSELNPILDRAVSATAATLNVEYTKILELGPDRESLLLRAGTGWQPGLVGRATVGAGLDSQAGYTLASDKPVIVTDLANETRFAGPPLLHDHGVVSGISTVIGGRDGKPYGVLGAHSSQPRAFTQDDLNFLQAIANIIAMSVDRWRVERDLTLYRRIFQNSSEGIAIISPEGHYLEQNQAHETLTGYSDADLAGKTPALHLGEKAFAQIIEELQRNGRFDGEFATQDREGHQRDLDLSAFTVTDPTGNVAFHVGIKRDITERKRAQEAIARSEHRHRQLVESAPLAIAVHRDQEIIYANPAAARLAGASSPEELIGRSVLDFIQPDQQDALLQAARASRTNDAPSPAMNARLVGLDGSALDVELVSVPYTDEHGPATQVLIRDVTRQHQAEASLRDERERLGTLVQVSPIGIIIWEPSTDKVLLANPEAGKILRRPVAEGEPLREISAGMLIRKQDGTTYEAAEVPAARAARTGERVRAERLTLEFPDGHTQSVLASAAPFLDPKQEVTAVTILLQDIQALTENERLRDQFLGMVTHELRSPLVVIKSATAIAKEDASTAPEAAELLEAIDEQADRMLSLIANLLDMAQIEAGAFSIAPRPTDIRDVLTRAVETMSAVSPVRISLEIPDGLPAVNVDTQRIGQVMTNLLSNAAQFADSDSAIRVSGWQDSRSIVVAVRNTGPSIPRDKAGLLFQKFSRISSGDGHRAGGAGLGLSICKGIVEAHKGAIWAKSVEAARETTFYFRLPLEGDAESGEQPRGEGANTGGDGRDDGDEARYHILAVDDEPVVLRYVQNLLKRTGYDVSTTTDGREAVKKVRELSPDLVLLDLMMVDISGFEVLEQIRAFSNVPVIFLSASNRDQDKVQGLNLGADDYITKPFSTT
ncbi:MAG: PAS domain S-box protein, partial [Dehalococcoidia bacterium]